MWKMTVAVSLLWAGAGCATPTAARVGLDHPGNAAAEEGFVPVQSQALAPRGSGTSHAADVGDMRFVPDEEHHQ